MNHAAYLDVRCAYAVAKLNLQISEQFGALLSAADASTISESCQFEDSDPCLCLTDQIEAESGRAEQIDIAESLGWCDAQAGCDERVPFLFADEQSLSEAWERGVDQYHLTVELENCSWCRAAGFYPCPCHG
ncbi:hypothetical protein BHUM_01884 [Candidatus Burkholderia humilis]|nr:hypothetical protein BHUM_01884 [Candidatus Burkholderia humilis]